MCSPIHFGGRLRKTTKRASAECDARPMADVAGGLGPLDWLACDALQSEACDGIQSWGGNSPRGDHAIRRAGACWTPLRCVSWRRWRWRIRCREQAGTPTGAADVSARRCWLSVCARWLLKLTTAVPHCWPPITGGPLSISNRGAGCQIARGTWAPNLGRAPCARSRHEVSCAGNAARACLAPALPCG